MKKKFNWVIKSKHILIIMILVCLSLMALAAAVKLPAGPVKNIVGYAVIPFQKGINSIGTALDGATVGLQSKQKLVKKISSSRIKWMSLPPRTVSSHRI